MPGKQVEVPTSTEIEKWYNKWNDEKDQDKKAKLLQSKLEEYLSREEPKTKENGPLVLAGMVAPTAAMLLKRRGENVPQLKKFRLSLIPDFVFVPSCTILALVGAKMLQVNRATKT